MMSPVNTTSASTVATRLLFGLLSITISGHGIAQDNGEVSFKNDVLPGLLNSCAACHRAEDSHGYLIIDEENTYQAIVNVNAYQLPSMKRIEPGKPEQNYLWLKSINEHHAAGGYGWNMPVMIGLYGPIKHTLHQWILEGAKNN